MKYRIITQNEDLTALLRNASFVDTLTAYDNSKGLKNIVEDVIIIDSSVIKLSELEEIYDASMPKIYLVDSKSKETGDGFENLHIVKTKNTNEETVTFLKEYIANDLIKLSNVICFCGATRLVGTTMVAESIAEYINGNSELSVALLSFTLNQGLEYNPYESMSLDSVLSRVQANILTEESIKKELLVIDEEMPENDKKRIYYMQGLSEAAEYDSTDISEIVTIASKAFDVVIVDLGGTPTRMMFPLLKKAKNIYVVTTPNIKALTEFNVNGLGKDFDKKDFKVIINKQGIYDGYSKAYMKSNFNYDIVGVLPHSEYAYNAEIDQKTLMQYDDFPFRKTFTTIARNITYENDIRSEKRR